MKITTKTTKEQLKNFLGANATAVKKQDKNLFERMDYTSKAMKKDEASVTRKDLVDLAKEVISVLGDKVVELTTPATPVVAENSVKKLAKGVSKKQEVAPASDEKASEEEAEAEEPAKEEKKADTTAKKSLGGKKKTAPKKDGVTALDGTDKSDKTVQMAKMFPATLTVGDETYELAQDIKTIEDLHKELENDADIIFAYYWTKRHLKQFPYFGGWLGQPKQFDNDLDLATCIYVSDENKVSYQISMYTEAVYTIIASDFAEEDGIRTAGGIEYQIYRKK